MNDLPEIRIKDAWLLRQEASTHLHKLWGKDGEPLADDEWMEQRVSEYQGAWKPFERKVLAGMTEIMKLSFKQNVIDVYIAPWFHAFSDPLVVGVIYEPDLFVDILTHELLHRLLTDYVSRSESDDLLSEWKKLFGENHSRAELVHIPVHAVHKALYLDVLKAPERLQRDIERATKHGATAYIKAWEYVESHDDKELIEKLKALYKSLVSTSNS